jgi:hypothetical protein
MSVQVKQEGEFKMSKKTTPKKLNKIDDIVKVDLSIPKKDADITKVVIPSNNTEDDAIQKQETDESVLRAEQPEMGLQEMEQGDKDSIKNVIEEVQDQQSVIEETKLQEKQLNNAINQYENTGKKLPENIEKLVEFMEETGGTVEDYVRLNVDYSTINEHALLKEYYKKTKPYLSEEEIEYTIEDSFSFDADLEEEREIRRKKLAFKEEIEKAKGFLDGVKRKYYDEIKIKSDISPERQEAIDFFNRYKEDQEKVNSRHERFKLDTKKLFTNDFKGFEFGVGEKKFRYGITNNEQVAENQSDISNFIRKFLDKDGNIADTAGYHKALYTAMNSDKIAQHFYEQGKADAVKEVISNSKNPSGSQPRQAPNDVFVNGLKVKSVSGFDSSKLRIKTKKFN